MNMDVWEKDSSGKKCFKYGKEDYCIAAETAQQCKTFFNDDEDETVCDDDRSCYNCRYRRWIADSFECMKP